MKDHTEILITTGKFKGWRGTISKSISEYDKKEHKIYYTIFPTEKKTRQGMVLASSIGLGLITNIPQNHIKLLERR
jgi:hypothetical protein